jgi:hypothetical protein
VEDGDNLKLQKQDKLELVAMADRFGQQGDRNTTRTRHQRSGKNGGLTRKSWVWSERSEEGRSSWISPKNGEEEVYVVVVVVVPGLIP